jgi:hypothetical protein
MGFIGWPEFDDRGTYTGPLPRHCGHKPNHESVGGRDQKGIFETQKLATFAHPFNQYIATLIANTITTSRCGALFEAGRMQLAPKNASNMQALARLANDTVTREDEDEVTSEEEADGSKKEKFGAGRWGRGVAMSTRKRGRRAVFHDGSGLCSPGRWKPEDRLADPLGRAEIVRTKLWQAMARHMDVRATLYKLATGKVKESPFPVKLIAEAEDIFIEELIGVAPASEEGIALKGKISGQPFRLGLIEKALQIQGDPDHKIFGNGAGSFQTGVRNGLGTRLPRTPAVYERKKKFRKYELDEFEPFCNTSRSVEENMTQFEMQLEEEIEFGRMEEWSLAGAQQEWGDTLRTASIMALEKSDKSLRIVHNGTHHVHVNPNIRVRDMLRYPGVAERKTMMAAIKDNQSTRFGLKGDVSAAHRLVLIDKADWGSQAFMVGRRLIVNKVGTQGIGSAAYWWSREVGAIGRLLLYMTESKPLWQLIFADDFDWTAEGSETPELLLLPVLLLVLIGTPLAWAKFAGGVEYEWIGLWTDWMRFSTGLSLKRGSWIADYCKKRLELNSVLAQELREVLGRFVFAAQAIEHLFPLLGPLYAWVSMLPPGAFVKLPGAVRLLLRFIEYLFRNDEWRITKVQGEKERASRKSFRADARAQGEVIEGGGWLLPDSGDPAEASWISFELNRDNARWAYVAGEPFRSIAAVELYTTLVTVMTLCGKGSDGFIQRTSLAGDTDNQGNTYAVGRLLSTKFPLNIVLMELALQLHSRGMTLDLSWIPREQNLEADELSNGIFRQFTPERRVTVVVEDLEFLVLPALMEEAEVLYGDILTSKKKKQEARDLAKSKDAALTIDAADGKKRLVELTPRRSVRRKPSEKLRVSQPW